MRECSVQKVENGAGNVESVFSQKEIVQRGEIDGLLCVEKGIIRKSDFFVEADALVNFAKTFDSESLEECLKKPNEVVNLSCAVENVFDVTKPMVADEWCDRRSLKDLSWSLIMKYLSKGIGFQNFLPVHVSTHGRRRSC